MKRVAAGFLILGAILLILGGDLFIVLKWGYAFSVSDFMHWLGFNFPIVCLLTGIVLGHFWWPIQADVPKP